MIQSILLIAVTVITAISLGALFWGYRRKREEKRRRKQGIVTIPVDTVYLVTGGCLGVMGFFGLLYLIMSLTFDLLDQVSGPDWLIWVAAIGLLTGFFLLAGWGAFGIGSSFALNRLVVDKERIRLVKRGRTKIAIFWNKQWQLERMAHLQQTGLSRETSYSLLMRLRQGNRELQLVFDVPGEEVGGLPEYDGRPKGLQIFDQAEWLQAEIRFRHEQWEEAPKRSQHTGGIKPSELSALTPDVSLMDALKFTEEELAGNRSGIASDLQARLIRRDQKLTLGTYSVMATIFGVGALFSLYLLLQGRPFDAVGPWLIVLLLAAVFCLLMAMASREALRSEILVKRISGWIRLARYSSSGEYWLRIGDEAFHITKPLFDALENETPYHLYIARFGSAAQEAKLLSAEELSHPV